MENWFQNFSHYLHQTSPWAYWISFWGGVLASLTPCVYPILPILIGSMGTAGAQSRLRGLSLSLIFVLGMAVSYSLMGLVSALTGTLFGKFTTHPIAYLLVGNICLFFALSMLGLFEIQLPGQWGKARLETQKKGAAQIFLMGATSGLVAAPCTVPVLGVLLAFVAESRNLLFGFSLLFVFAFGLGFLLILLGTFTGFLVSLPKSGPWLLRIKQAFGLLLVLVAEFFLVRAGKMM